MRILEVVGLTKRFGGRTALDAVSFTVEEGQIVALLGPEAAGKSTCLRCISGRLASDSGRVILDGLEITGEPASRVARAGIVHPDRKARSFIGATIFEHVAAAVVMPGAPSLAALFGRWTGREARRRAETLLSRVGLAADASRRIDRLSPSTERRMALAVALARHPRLMLLDDPFAGLPPEDREALAASIRRLSASGVTVLLAARKLETERALADRTLMLDRGALVASERLGRAGDPHAADAFCREQPVTSAR